MISLQPGLETTENCTPGQDWIHLFTGDLRGASLAHGNSWHHLGRAAPPSPYGGPLGRHPSLPSADGSCHPQCPCSVQVSEVRLGPELVHPVNRMRSGRKTLHGWPCPFPQGPPYILGLMLTSLYTQLPGCSVAPVLGTICLVFLLPEDGSWVSRVSGRGEEQSTLGPQAQEPDSRVHTRDLLLSSCMTTRVVLGLSSFAELSRWLY